MMVNEGKWTFLRWGLPSVVFLLLLFVMFPAVAFGVNYSYKCVCRCPQSVYETTTRRTFCGEELRRFGGAAKKSDCFYKCVMECPDDGPGRAIFKNLVETFKYCALDCHGKRNPNNCDIVIHKDRSVAENSYNHLFGNGLPPSHVNKTEPK
jgi:hypothetical protein